MTVISCIQNFTSTHLVTDTQQLTAYTQDTTTSWLNQTTSLKSHYTAVGCIHHITQVSLTQASHTLVPRHRRPTTPNGINIHYDSNLHTLHNVMSQTPYNVRWHKQPHYDSSKLHTSPSLRHTHPSKHYDSNKLHTILHINPHKTSHPST